MTAAHVALIERHLGKVADVEKDLLALAREWMGRRGDHEPHMLLVRHIISEGSHLPADVIEEWQRIGPRGTAEAVRAALLRLGEQGHLAVDEANSAEAGRHFLLLIPGSVTVDTFFGVVPMSDAEVDARVSSGLGVF